MTAHERQAATSSNHGRATAASPPAPPPGYAGGPPANWVSTPGVVPQWEPNQVCHVACSSIITFLTDVPFTVQYYVTPPLEPGKPGRCHFHSQHYRGFQQDRRLFIAMGGTVDETTCTPHAIKSRYSSSGLNCACVAPSDPRAFNQHFLDIGANDGQYLSNTLFFETQMGWTGLCVEGSPSAYGLLSKSRTKCKNVHGVIGKGLKSARFFTFDRPGSWEVGMSCMEGSAHAAGCNSEASARNWARSSGATFSVDTVPGSELKDHFSSQVRCNSS